MHGRLTNHFSGQVARFAAVLAAGFQPLAGESGDNA